MAKGLASFYQRHIIIFQTALNITVPFDKQMIAKPALRLGYLKYININKWDVITNPWASYQIRKIAGCACARNAGNVFPRRPFQRKPLVSDPDMHHGTCVTHVPWCMSGSLTCGNGENVLGIPGACAPGILRIWQEAHAIIPAELGCGGEIASLETVYVITY